MKVGFVSLGCSKNLIDTEVAIGKFKEHKFEIINDPKEAEIIVVNTCGFIESAKQEAIDTILEMANTKRLFQDFTRKQMIHRHLILLRLQYPLNMVLHMVEIY